VDELLPCAREKEQRASSSWRGELAAMGEKSSSSMLLPWGEQRGGWRGGEEGCWWRLEIFEGWEWKIAKGKGRGVLFIDMW
jgi:hypothetical protein